MIASLFRRRSAQADINPLYGAIMAAALQPELYARCHVPDTFEGRFEAATLHMALALIRLKQLPPPADAVAQALVDQFFGGLDAAMRQIGIGDTAVPKRMKKFLQGFYGRLQAYEAALAPDAPPALLGEAISRNVLDGTVASQGLVDRLRLIHQRLAAVDLGALLTAPQTLFQVPDTGGAP